MLKNKQHRYISYVKTSFYPYRRVLDFDFSPYTEKKIRIRSLYNKKIWV